MNNQDPDYFEAMESQYLVQDENFELGEQEQDNDYYILQGICPQCRGWGEVIDAGGFGMEPCFNPDCLNGELIAK